MCDKMIVLRTIICRQVLLHNTTNLDALGVEVVQVSHPQPYPHPRSSPRPLPPLATLPSSGDRGGGRDGGKIRGVGGTRELGGGGVPERWKKKREGKREDQGIGKGSLCPCINLLLPPFPIFGGGGGGGGCSVQFNSGPQPPRAWAGGSEGDEGGGFRGLRGIFEVPVSSF